MSKSNDTIKEYKIYVDGNCVGIISNTANQKTYLSRLRSLVGFDLVPVFN